MTASLRDFAEPSPEVPLHEDATQKPALPNPPDRPASLVSALARAQLEIFNPVKNRQVSFQNRDGRSSSVAYEYAELSTVLEIIRRPLASNGIAFTQSPELRGEDWHVVTRLEHESGQSREFLYPLIISGNDKMKREQQFAAGYTYAKRQALKGIFGIADDTEDTDAQDTKAVEPKQSKPQNSQEPRPSTASKTAGMPNHAPTGEKAEEPSLLDELVKLAFTREITPEDMSSHIAKCVGAPKKAKDLSDEELRKVLHFVKQFVKPKPNGQG